MNNFFRLISKDLQSNARTGELKINEVSISTPTFMPVGTKASIKGLWTNDLNEMGYKIILSNTYHLALRPGTDLIFSQGGLHKFMNWEKIILTDSGGYQVFSLSDRVKFRVDGVEFSSHIDGKKHFFSPLNVLEHQAKLGSNINMVLDDCPSSIADEKRILESLKRTHDWAKISLEHFYKTKNDKLIKNQDRFIFGIAQGGLIKHHRIESLDFIQKLQIENFAFDGIAIGGLSVGEHREDLYDILNIISKNWDNKIRPRYLMGVGAISDILEAVKNGIDIFDCVLPTRNARNGQAFTNNGVVRLRNSINKTKNESLDINCDCKVCKNYTLSYIHHLFNSKEMLGPIMLSFHNLYFYYKFMEKMREAINENKFIEFYNKWKGYN